MCTPGESPLGGRVPFERESPPWEGEPEAQEEKGTTEDEMAGWHHRLNGCELEQAPGDGEGQGSLAFLQFTVTKSRTRMSDWTKKKHEMK